MTDAMLVSPSVSRTSLRTPVKRYLVGSAPLAVDLNWTAINTAFAGTANVAGGIGARSTGLYAIKDQGIFSVIFRAQRNY